MLPHDERLESQEFRYEVGRLLRRSRRHQRAVFLTYQYECQAPFQMRRLLTLWVALLATQLASALSAKQTTIADWDFLLADAPKLPIWTFLHWIGLVGIIFEVLLADRAFGTEPGWKTRPIARWQMAAAKLAFIALFTVLLPGGFEFFAFTGQGVPAGEAAQGLVLAVLTQTFLVSWVTMLACVCRKKTFEVLVLAPMSLAAPFLIAGMMAWLTERLRESGTFGLLLHREPPDFLEQPVSWLIAYTLVWGGLPILIGIWLVLAGYLENVRRRAILALVGLAFCLAVVPVGLLPFAMTQGKPIPITATHVLTAAEMEWKPHWKEQSGRVNNAWLEATFRLPVLTNQAGALLLSEYVHGWATIEGRLPGSSRWKEFYVGNCASSELDGYVNLLLSHTNSPLGRELAGARIVLNPSAAAAAHFGPLTWWDEGPLTRWGEVKLALRLELTERELVVVRRLTYADYVSEQRRKPDHLTPDDDAARLARSVFTTTPSLEIPFAD